MGPSVSCAGGVWAGPEAPPGALKSPQRSGPCPPTPAEARGWPGETAQKPRALGRAQPCQMGTSSAASPLSPGPSAGALGPARGGHSGD